MTTSIFERYCVETVIPFFQQKREQLESPNSQGLFIVDRQPSRTNHDLMELFKKNIDVFVLPSHTSGVTQPLDVSVFGPMKSNMSIRCERISREKKNTLPDLRKEIMIVLGIHCG